MSKNLLILAVAGSGKTTHIVNQVLTNPNKKTLITTYTDTNTNEIRNKFIERNGFVPANVTIKPWFTFLIEDGARPYQNYLFEERISGLLLVNNRSGFMYKYRGIPRYWPETAVRNHYFTIDNKIFSDKLSKFVVRCNELSKNAVINRISKRYESIYIDEVQDLAGYDLDIIDSLGQSTSKITLVGDPRQVTYLTHNEQKYEKYTSGKIIEFINDIASRRSEWIIDTESLRVSHRNNPTICELSNRLYPELPEAQAGHNDLSGNDGVFFITKDELIDYCKSVNPVHLRYDRRTKIDDSIKNIFNFGESKGLTFAHIIIWPTKDMLKWFKGENVQLECSTKAKLYVAITRAMFSIGIVNEN